MEFQIVKYNANEALETCIMTKRFSRQNGEVTKQSQARVTIGLPVDHLVCHWLMNYMTKYL
jgi:hypothetical protein